MQFSTVKISAYNLYQYMDPQSRYVATEIPYFLKGLKSLPGEIMFGIFGVEAAHFLARSNFNLTGY